MNTFVLRVSARCRSVEYYPMEGTFPLANGWNCSGLEIFFGGSSFADLLGTLQAQQGFRSSESEEFVMEQNLSDLARSSNFEVVIRTDFAGEKLNSSLLSFYQPCWFRTKSNKLFLLDPRAMRNPKSILGIQILIRSNRAFPNHLNQVTW